MFEKCIYFNTNALARQINKIWDDAFKPFGLSPSHAYVLRVVLDQPGISMKQISEELELAPSTVTRFVDSLINKDFLKRVSNDDDKRGTQIFPTQQSKKIHRKLENTGQALYANMNEVIGKKAFAELVTDMRTTRKQL
ncbi:MAG: MarR family transcriptional regulator [endosymbiont of Galathealinum brachiosum]|uniref:MarR family transcriptional regulator n=1 Tax=endosymbiont of Galathealinum brachiosum TaxID=2200906 RepID=A0A370DDK2_9GAMM|nr:MAG: MarR family transcriptional regulator [endosymbiont of Galathealinum brachiosum]